MNKIETALSELRQMDEMAELSSPVHRLHSLVKLLGTAAYILTVISFDRYDLFGLLPMLLIPVFLYQLAGIPLRTCFYRLRYILPLVCAVGLFNPFFDRSLWGVIGSVRISGGTVSMLTLMGKGVLCLTASFLLAATTRLDAVCAALRLLRLPSLLVNLLLLTGRYVSVLMEEAGVMTDAYRLRAPGQKGVHISAWGSFLGQLLLRSMDRAERLYGAMRLRGYHGHFHYVDLPPLRAADLFAALCLGAVLAVFRLFPVVSLLGSLFA